MLVIAWLSLGSLFVILGCALVEWHRHFPLNRLEDVIAVLRGVERSSLEDLLDAHKEADMRASMSAREFRQEQDIRIYKTREFLGRRRFNAIEIVNWACRTQERIPAKNPQSFENASRALLLQEIVEAGTRYITYSNFALMKLRLWSLLRIDLWIMLPAPSLADLREAFDIDGLHAYERLSSAIGYLSLFHGERCYDNLMLALHGRVPMTD